MISMDVALLDRELGFTQFTVRRVSYHRRNGESEPTERERAGAGCMHPGAPEMLELLPEEERREDFIAVYTGFNLSTGENYGRGVYTAPDRIIWQGKEYRVVRVRNWQAFGYTQALAVRVYEESDL